MSSTTKPFALIRSRYLLLMFIPFYEDELGEIWLERAWHQDFVRHTEYLLNLTLLAPKRKYRADIPDLVPFKPVGDGKVRFVALKSQDSKLLALKNLPHTILTLAREIKRAEIVHSGIIGWPFPLGWIANPMALYLGRKLVLVVESAFWRNPKPGVIHKALSTLTEVAGRYFMHRADLAIVTQPSYLETLRGPSSRGIGFVNPASWVNENDMISAENLQASWNIKRALKPIKLIFVGRLTKEKGIRVLLDAIDALELLGIQVHIDMIGQGPMHGECMRSVAPVRTAVRLRLLAPVTYGQPFFELLQEYHGVLVPSISDEQPRIIFDAFSQGVPVVAANTDGIRPYVNESDGWLVESGSVSSLTDAIASIARNSEELEKRGNAAHQNMGSRTHREMHRTRSNVLAELEGAQQL
jgi:glycosyltransferase involved in cell wall biosynthesis